MSDRTQWHPLRWLQRAAWFSILIHIAGLAFGMWGMRYGTPLVSLDERVAYLGRAAQNWANGWTIGWGVWMGCAIGILTWMTIFSAVLTDKSDGGTGVSPVFPIRVSPVFLVRLAQRVVLVAVAFDLTCDAIYIFVFPRVAAAKPDPLFFQTLERCTNIASLLIANGLYSLGVGLAAWGLWRARISPPLTALCGLGSITFGLIMPVLGLPDVTWPAAFCSGPTILFYCAWTYLATRDVTRFIVRCDTAKRTMASAASNDA